ncbi:MAG: carboxypeptidase M32 [Pseudomonadota bacterium]
MLRHDQLSQRFAKIFRIHESIAILNWDQAVVMPRGSIESRAEQLATLTQLAHDILASPETSDLIETAMSAAPSDDFQAANHRLMHRAYMRATALDSDFAAYRARVCAHAEVAWREARAEGQYDIFLPHIERVVGVVQQSSLALSSALNLKPYDVLLDEYQPGLREDAIEPLFGELLEALPSRLDAAIANNPQYQGQPFPVPAAKQEVIFKSLMARLGFDFDHGRLDESTHPFCGGVYADHRVTTRYDAMDITSGLMGILHETGHALYEAGLPKEWISQPVGQSHGMLIHESQSLFVEMQICRSPAFLSFLSQVLIEGLGNDLAWDKANLEHCYRQVARSLIRVDADEVTYPLHVIQRYRLERALLANDLMPSDLPGAWSDMANEILGVRPDNDREGCLQDIHWSHGIFGYFPCYTLGALFAAQLARQIRLDLGEFEQSLQSGDFVEIIGWLRNRVHSRASALELDDLVLQSTGTVLGTADFLAHLDNRYLRTAHA